MTPEFERDVLAHAERLTKQQGEFVSPALVELVANLSYCARYYKREYEAMRDRWYAANPPPEWLQELMVRQMAHHCSHSYPTQARRRRDGERRG